jgi:hypothetical protein
MKSYWIAAAFVVFIAWPSGSKAYVPGQDQARAEEPPVQQNQPSNSSIAMADSNRGQASSEAPASVTKQKSAPAPASTQSKSSYMLVELSQTLKAKKLKPGDKIKAEVSQDVVARGKIIIPVETELVGHVTEVAVRDRTNPESRLGIVFDRILLKHYHDINFQGVIQAVAPPVLRKSKVDEPSQMLPPSMVAGDLRQSSPTPAGRSATTGRPSPNASSAMSSSTSMIGAQTPLTVKQSPTTNAPTGTSAASLETETSLGGSSLSVGMPQGVRGLKGLSLSTGATRDTPGPVIVSNTANVKLDSGTQILLRVVSIEAQKAAAK